MESTVDSRVLIASQKNKTPENTLDHIEYPFIILKHLRMGIVIRVEMCTRLCLLPTLENFTSVEMILVLLHVLLFYCQEAGNFL